MDYVWMWCGFFAARLVADWRWTVFLIVLVEAVAARFGRDCLTFTALQLVYPLEVIDDYQQAINPNQRPEQSSGD
jgi:hypothetical protein